MSRPRVRAALRCRPAHLLIVLVSLAGVSLLAPPASAHSESAPAVTRPSTKPSSGYVALGDSYAAGEGLPPFEDATAGADGCHRSASQSYPALLGTSGLRDFAGETSVACSGAVTYDLVASRTQPPQIDALNARTRTVTVTIGGNDSGFSLVFGDCVYSPDPSVQAVLPGRGPGCAGRDDAAVSTNIAALSGVSGAPSVPGIVPLPKVLAAVSAAAPRATVYITGYPRLFGTRPTDAYGCQVSSAAPLFVASADAGWIRDKAGELNAVIRAAAGQARAAGADVRYVDVAATFRGHDLCDSRSAWLNGVVLASTAPLALSAATFHPTARGQRAYARAVRETARCGPGRPRSPVPALP